MKLVKSLLLGSAAGLVTVAAAQAADLPTRKAAPVEYVRVCDAYGAGFFYIPGTDTCLRVGGLVLAQMGIQPSSQLYSIVPGTGAGAAAVGLLPGFGVVGVLPAATGVVTTRGREIFGYTAAGRIELDARTQSPYGTVRTFIRLQSSYGSSANYTTGSLQSALGFNAFANAAGPTASREIAYLDKAFIQFAGITAGRVQSFFDFYADAINYTGLHGPNNTVWAGAYTFTFGGGFSLTGAIEDAASHRGPVYSVASLGAAVGGVGPAAVGTGSAVALVGAARMPNLVANLRFDQPWGAVQISGALNQVRANLFPAAATTSGATGNPALYAQSVNTTSSIGFAINGGVQFNLDSLAPGDKLWLQATYAKGAIGYVQGNNMAFVSGPSSTTSYGVGNTRSQNGVGWSSLADADCVFTYAGTCDKSSAFAVLAALKHYWTPTVSSAFFGGYYQVTYSQNARMPINPFFTGAGPATGVGTGGPAFALGMNNFRDVRIGTNLVWTPIKNFDIGAEFTYARYMSDRPFGLAPDPVLQTFGLPKWVGTTSQYLGAIRMIRAF